MNRAFASGERASRAIDATRLPEDVMARIDALAPGEDLVITRDGEPVARISGVPGTVVIGTVMDPVTPSAADEEPSATGKDVTVVVTAMELSDAARSSLSDRLGADYIVLDIHAAPVSADVLLVPPVSPQLIGSLRSAFPEARVVVAEIEDDELGVSYQGPVRRLLDAGAEAYLPPATVPRLAQLLDRTLTHRRRPLDGSPTPEIESLTPEIAPRRGTPDSPR
ncbi:hypothetical protein OHA98_23695 [Streptomyces sp. NBC_00654]|uniref:hypothetical protein n=1 Tax=Streptomyces sp. NBC_00654 TaxID=2975799 RepID=UPI002255BDA2|nr:hypothetical protein [Streptomyces sp. NBC_00654]MCX4967707.1 hypothetical protein [Streptomyces sp. NBC_00654]